MKHRDNKLRMVRIGLLALALLMAWSSVSEARSKKIIYSFGGFPDANFPGSSLVRDVNGVLYGTASGGQFQLGSVYSLTPPQSAGGNWTEATLHFFAGGGDGADPSSPLIVAKDGSLYGTTSGAGTVGCGTFFQLAPPAVLGGNWSNTTLFNFGTGSDCGPHFGLTANGRGTLYGTTSESVYSLTPPQGPGGSWTRTTLQTFNLTSPLGKLILGKNETLYGVTQSGGTFDKGTVFSLTPPKASGGSWTEAVLYSFGSSPTDGTFPNVDLAAGKNGVLYGMTFAGGSDPVRQGGCGTVYSLTPPSQVGQKWTETILHSFMLNADGCFPLSGVVVGSGGTLFGTLSGIDNFIGGTGALFGLTPPANTGGIWTETQLQFTGQPDGANPEATLLLAKGGALFGPTPFGGAFNGGAVFEVTP